MNSKNLEIEYLRAIAIGLTLLSHLPGLLPFHQDFFQRLFSVYMPWTGVDLFFCISGFVVSKAYLDSLDEQRAKGRFWLAAQQFWIRRIYRLLPTAWLWVLIPLLLSVFFNSSGVFGSWYENLRGITAVMTFSGNLANQFSLALGPHAVYWSLALEEQFYFIFPLFLLLVKVTRWRVSLLLFFIFIQFFFDRNPFGSAASAIASSFRLDAMLWGVLIFFFTRTDTYRVFEPTFLHGSPFKVFGVSVLLFYLLCAIPAQMIDTPIAVGLIAIVSAILVFMASFNKGYIYGFSVLSPLLLWMGSRSYGMYVIHYPAYRLSYEAWHRYAADKNIEFNGFLTLELLITAGFLVVVLSELNYRFVEQPLRKKGAEIARGRLQESYSSNADKSMQKTLS